MARNSLIYVEACCNHGQKTLLKKAIGVELLLEHNSHGGVESIDFEDEYGKVKLGGTITRASIIIFLSWRNAC